MVFARFRPGLGVVTASITLSSPDSFLFVNLGFFPDVRTLSVGTCCRYMLVYEYVNQLYIQQYVPAGGTGVSCGRRVLKSISLSSTYGGYVRTSVGNAVCVVGA